MPTFISPVLDAILRLVVSHRDIDAQYRRLAVSIEETHQNNSSSAVAKMSDNAKRNHLSIFNGVSLEFLVGDMFAQSAFISNQSTVPSFGIRSYCPGSPYPLMWCHGQKHPPPSWPNLETIVKSTLSYCVLSTNIDATTYDPAYSRGCRITCA